MTPPAPPCQEFYWPYLVLFALPCVRILLIGHWGQVLEMQVGLARMTVWVALKPMTTTVVTTATTRLVAMMELLLVVEVMTTSVHVVVDDDDLGVGDGEERPGTF